LALFLGMAALVLVIACANVANLQLVRAVARQKEIAVRQALGAGRRRVVRQLLVENVLLALAGGACGLLLALCLDRVVCRGLSGIASVRIHAGLHPRALLFAAGVSLVTGVAFGLAPAVQLVRRNIIPHLKESAGYGALPGRSWNSYRLLVVAQIAVALVVMAFSVLCLRSVMGLHRTDPGYDTRQILVVRLDLDSWLLDRPDLCRLMEDLRERVSRWPTVAAAGLAVCPPVSEMSGGRNVIDIEGTETPVKGEINWQVNTVGPGYFQTLGQALLAGRSFTAQDGPDAPRVIVVNEVMAKQYWPNQNPLGKRVRFLVGEGEEPDVREVVGVVKCVKLRSILEEPTPIAYLALDQQPKKLWKMTPVLLVRAGGDPGPLVPMIRREAAAAGTPAALDIRTVAQRISGLLMTQQILSVILNLFGAVGLLLSATGIYAVMAYAIRQRTREIGIRIALGARGRDVVIPVLLRGTLLLTAGLSLGGALSLAGTRLLAGRLGQIRQWDKYFLQGIYTWDPVTYAITILVVVAVTLTACYLPARRAARVDPMVALRYE
jgi:predicted permease